MDKRCEFCTFCHMLKELKNGVWEYRDVCTLFPQTDKGYDAFALIVDKDDTCENYQSR